MTYLEYFYEAQRLRGCVDQRGEDVGDSMLNADILTVDAVSGYVLMALDSLGILGEEDTQEVVETMRQKIIKGNPLDAEDYVMKR